jgi:transcriptional regulator with XRE-family HTH domain
MSAIATKRHEKSLERNIATMVASSFTVKRFGEFVRELREERGLNRSQFAVLAGVGHPTRIREVEDEDKPVDPSLSRIQQIAKGFGLTLTALMARWEGVDLVWTKPGVKALAETKGDQNDTGLERGGATMDDDLGQSLLTTLGLVPAEQREAFVTHCFHTAMSWRSRSRHAATGTDDPKA